MSVALTRSRFTNALRCYWNYALSRFGLVRISHMPLFVSVEPAAVCQLKCPECPVGQAKTAALTDRFTDRPATPDRVQTELPLMPREVWERTLAEIRETAITIQFYFQGEPLLNKNLPQMISEAHAAGLYTIVSTNAQAITEETAKDLVAAGLDRIIVSMDGLTEESYGAYRIGGSLEQCKKALRYLHKAKSVCTLSVKRSVLCQQSGLIIELQVLRLKSNEHEWAEMRRVYKTLGADRLVFKTAQLYDYADGHPLMPSDPRYSRYIMGSDGKYHRRQLRKGCFRVWSGCVITTNGDVLPCCYDKAHAHAYGNNKESAIGELFRNAISLAFRKAAIHEQPDICKECWK